MSDTNDIKEMGAEDFITQMLQNDPDVDQFVLFTVRKDSKTDYLSCHVSIEGCLALTKTLIDSMYGEHDDDTPGKTGS